MTARGARREKTGGSRIGKEFQVAVKPAGQVCEQLDALRQEMQRAGQEILTCRNQLSISGTGGTMIKQQLGLRHSEALRLSGQLESFKQTLEQILKLYADCEEKVLLAGSVSISEEAKDHPSQEQDFWQRLWAWLFGGEPPSSGASVSAEQEEAADRKFMEEVAELAESERYSEETWEKASTQERKEILQSYLNEVADILGVDVEKEIVFIHMPPDEQGATTFGTYTHSSKSIRINEYVLEHDGEYGSYRLMTTVVHELRHAYQHAAIDHPEKYQVSQETLDAWKHSFDTYAEEKAKGFVAYRKILVEQDARKFAGQE